MIPVPHSKQQPVIGLRSSDDQDKNPMSASPQHKQHDVYIDNCVPYLFCLQLSDAVMKKKLAHDVFHCPCFLYLGLTPVFPVCHFVENQSIATNHFLVISACCVTSRHATSITSSRTDPYCQLPPLVSQQDFPPFRFGRLPYAQQTALHVAIIPGRRCNVRAIAAGEYAVASPEHCRSTLGTTITAYAEYRSPGCATF